jgi:hypothetical protein
MEGNFKSLPSEIETEKDKLVLWVVTLFLYKIGMLRFLYCYLIETSVHTEVSMSL